ncbi:MULTISPECIES: acyl-CoA thioesterase [Pseudomonas]|jgi:acyl-CoA thioesterase FadM|uniref:acyl-CoA thioesterase n=1 Tax=Pseudomonas TaxID=286 RepID=UPI0003C7AFF1|nr:MULTISPECIES: thioesterase family protein [Pseudomonas]AIN58807.1 thioesterase [Pseudomonas soli]MCX5511395.1 acyl-CoA thioesterase [Pseudomonas sp. BJa3]MDW9406188.1 acyl-CoA thioesterase [Pseudomonas soli]PYC44404.1 acyl-CoA thioesterase [Pseudomonas soli]
MPFVTTRKILFGDCDPAGIVYTPRISYFVIEAIHEFLSHQLGGEGLRKLFAMGVMPPARALSIEFLAPMAWDDLIRVHVSSGPLGRTSFSFNVEGVGASGESCFRASMTQVCVCPDSKQPVDLPEALRRALSSTTD